jgi:peptide/nickel transport system permease protein
MNASTAWQENLSKALANRSFLVGLIITSLLALMAALSFVWTPYGVGTFDIIGKLKPPSAAHWLGTDHFGRDILSMIMVGSRNSIAVAFVSVVIGMGIGVPLGLWAAARGGVTDELLMRFNDLVFAFPALLSAVMITAVFGPGAINAIIAIGIFNIPVFARVARGAALSLWPREYILAARASGKGQPPCRSGHYPVLARYPCGSRPFLCRTRVAAANAELGPHAVRGPNDDQLGAAYGAISGPRHRHHRSWS